MTEPETGRAPRSWVPVAMALAFAGAAIGSTAAVPGAAPESSAEAVERYFGDAYVRSEVAIGLSYLSMLLFLWLSAWLATALRRGGQERPAAVVSGGGIAFVVLSGTGVLVGTAVAVEQHNSDLFRVDASTALALQNLSFELGAFAAVASIAVMVAGSAAARRAGFVTDFLGLAGQIWGVVAGLLGMLFAGPLPLVIWVLVMSSVLTWRPTPAYVAVGS